MSRRRLTPAAAPLNPAWEINGDSVIYRFTVPEGSTAEIILGDQTHECVGRRLRVYGKAMISLYLHIPFCRHKCNYCSFYSLTDFDKSEYIDAIIRCVQYFGKNSGENPLISDCRADTVYIGGGTPSVLPPKLIYRLFDAVYRNFETKKMLR